MLSTAPSRATPANSPRARDHDQISALIWPSVAMPVVRPIGPAATEASAPRVILPLTLASSPRWVVKAKTTPDDWTPAWKPMLPPVSLTKAGFDQVPSGVFTDSRPCPRRPPTTSPIFSVSGKIGRATCRERLLLQERDSV